MLKWNLTHRVALGLCLLGTTAQAQDAPPPSPMPGVAAPTPSAEKPAAQPDADKEGLYLIGPDGQKRHMQSMEAKQNDEYRKAIDSLPQGERYLIGVVLGPVPAEVRATLKIDASVGLFLVKVIDGKPAAKAGLKNGDVLCAVNGKGVSQPADVVRFVNEMKGQPVTLEIVREQTTIEIHVSPMEASKDLAEHSNPETVELSPEAMQKLRELGLTPGTQIVGPGVVVNSSSLLSREVIELKLKVGRLEQEVGQLQQQVEELKEILKSVLTPPSETPVN